MWAVWAGEEPYANECPISVLFRRAKNSLLLPAPSTPPEPASGYAQLMQECMRDKSAERPTAVQAVEQLTAMLHSLQQQGNGN
jgi:hypothetical protein